MRALGTWNKGHTERDETELYTETEAKNGTERQMKIKRIKITDMMVVRKTSNETESRS